MWGHVATCPYGIIRNVAAGGVALSGDVALLWHVTWLVHVPPPWDVASLWHVAWLGDMPLSAGVPMWGHVATCPYGMIPIVATAGGRCNVPLRQSN